MRMPILAGLVILSLLAGTGLVRFRYGKSTLERRIGLVLAVCAGGLAALIIFIMGIHAQ
jgi:hypothetical protein